MIERVAVTYYISRDSDGGELAKECGLWWLKPQRAKHDSRVTWIANNASAPGYFGSFPLDNILYWFRTTPDSDLQLIKAEQWSEEKKR